MGALTVLALVILLLYLLPARGQRRRFSYAPSGVVGLILVTLLVLLVGGVLPWGFAFGAAVP
jgi:hypothetical protein